MNLCTVRRHTHPLTPPNPHPHAHERLQRSTSVHHQVLVPLHRPLFEQHHDRRSAYDIDMQCINVPVVQRDMSPTKREIPQFLPTHHVLSFVYRRLDAPHHHRTDADRHDASKLRTLNRYNLARVLPIHVQGTANCLRLTTISSANTTDNRCRNTTRTLTV